MGLTNELAWSNSLISTFLRERFPHRDALVARRLHQFPGYTKVAVPDRAVLILGVAFELSRSELGGVLEAGLWCPA